MKDLYSALQESASMHRQLFDFLKREQVLPANTCPLIDEVLDELEIRHGVVPRNMEEIRSANSSLRNTGRTWYEFARDLLDDLEMTLKLHTKEVRA
jgi:hypothetical protein